MAAQFATRSAGKTIPIHPVRKDALPKWLKGQPKTIAKWATVCRFAAEPYEICLAPTRDGELGGVLLGVPERLGPYALSSLPMRLPKGKYSLAGDLSPEERSHAALSWALGHYQFRRYAKKPESVATLVWPDGVDRKETERLARAIFLVRDLINTPANDMGPPELAQVAIEVGERHGARVEVIRGEDLLAKNFPAVHAVGRAAAKEPCLIDLVWGDESKPKVTLVGKGVCFDTGGLNLKGESAMKLMKKDMGGAATVLGLADAIMDANLPVRLRVLIPAVENSVAGNAMRPLDVLATRKGLTIEVGNTDAEGRLILSDALTEADSETPDMLLDFATLTGAARVALGTDLPALFCNNEPLAAQLLKSGRSHADRLWRMPLYSGYRKQLDSRVADICNISNGPYGGAITAGLFLEEFVRKTTPWAHIDTMAFNVEDRPGRPQGGEALGLRAAYYALVAKYRA